MDSSLAKQLSTIIFGKDVNLRQHQAEALKASFSRDNIHNTVVTSGTGSGKTESFLLPILARILNESNDILEPPISKWWEKEWTKNDNWSGIRTGQSKRIMYILNPVRT